SAPWSAQDPAEKLPADREWSARHEEGRALEIGAGPFLMTGTGAGLMAGGTPFVVIEVTKGVFVRPALLFGRSLPSSGPDASLAATRLDACLRVAGLYTNRNGMQLDLCGGADVGVLLDAGPTAPYVAFGPSLDLRGELGGDLAAVLRGLFDVNAVQEHGDLLDTPLWAGRVELAMSWRLR
ncbi:MAG TPA: hypothetical protein VE987_22305, partial [Polyangiaceae bacterium]|nr:hypothetical protein [Polyangiaceae bacterium]